LKRTYLLRFFSKMIAQIRRLNKELESMVEYNSKYYSIRPTEDNLSRWECNIRTDNDSKYDGQTFTVEFIIPARYPFYPPKVRFTSPINHSCVGYDGHLSLDILGANWSPAWTIPHIGLAICSLLNEECDLDYSKKRQMNRTIKLKSELISKHLKNLSDI